jgi:hypothetical protein
MDIRMPVQVNHHQVGIISFTYESPVPDLKADGYGMGHFFNQLFERNFSLQHVTQHERERVLNEGKTRMSLQIRTGFTGKLFQFTVSISKKPFLSQCMGCVIGGDQIQVIIQQSLPETVPVFCCFYCGVTFNLIAQTGIVV